MKAYCKNGVVIATHDDVTNVPASAYGSGVVVVPCDAGVMVGGDQPELTADVLKSVAAAKRWEVENGGCAVAGFGVVPTDERTRAVLTAAYIKASTNPAYTIPKWKVGPGSYVTLTAAQIIAMANAVEAHVQACFSVNGDVDDEIDAETITTLEAIDAAAWPANS